MKYKHLKAYYPSYFLFLSIFIFLLYCNTLIWGEDGPMLWMPLLSEYLKGASTYSFSKIIFGGQNLLQIYGELPFWKVCRLLGLPALQTLNLTYFIFLASAFYLFRNIFWGISGEIRKIDQYFIFFFCLFTPMFFNRIYSGHLNLLFASMPFLVAISLIYAKKPLDYLAYIFICTNAFSIQGYQMILYGALCAPLLLVWLFYEQQLLKAKYFGSLLVILLMAILLSLNSLSAMLNFGFSHQGLRAIGDNVVYSYTTSIPKDLLFFLFPSANDFFHLRDTGFIHELSYPFALSIVAISSRNKKIQRLALTCTFLLILFFLFSSNYFPFNTLAHLPLVRAFRVPQRIFLIPSLLLSFLFLISIRDFFNFKFSCFFILAFLISQFFPGFEILALLVLLCFTVILPKFKTYISAELVWSLALATLFLGLPDKVFTIHDDDQNFKKMVEYVSGLNEKLKLSDPQKMIHFEASSLKYSYINMAANYIGIRTAEGYGHPPIESVKTLERWLKIKISPTVNLLYVKERMPHFKEILNDLKVTDIVFINTDGSYFSEPVKE